MYHLKNKFLSIGVKSIGAELAQINSTKNSMAFLWDANPDVWANHAPNLFPIVGGLKNDTYLYNNKTYKLPKHGFIRYNKDIKLISESDTELIFKLAYNEDTLEMYPFRFNYYIIYTLIENTLKVTYKVENCDSKPLLFSLGGHPAFKCPVFKNENYNDYSLEFEDNETSQSYKLDKTTGLVSNTTKSVFDIEKTIFLKPDLFSEDALIFKDLKSRKVALVSKNNGEILSVSYKDYNYLGLWAKPNAHFVCIEPWLGIADTITTNGKLKDKEAILQLEPNKTFTASYTIEIHQKHLV